MDNKRQMELIVAPIVVVIAIILVISTFKKTSGPKNQEAAGMPAGESMPAEARGNPVKLPGDTVFASRPGDGFAQDSNKKYNVEKIPWGRDPFVLDKASLFSPGMDQDKAAKIEQLSRLKLTGMIISAGNLRDSIAVINGENLKIGDVISGFILKEIKQNSVILEWGNENFELKLWEEEVGKKQEPILEQQ